MGKGGKGGGGKGGGGGGLYAEKYSIFRSRRLQIFFKIFVTYSHFESKSVLYIINIWLYR